MADVITKLADIINPQVMADMVNAKLQAKIKALPFATVDTSLQGQAGSTISVPQYAYVGDAVDVAEGEEIPLRGMTATSKEYEIKMAAIGISITDKAALCGHGNPVGAANNQIAKSILAKCDADAMAALLEASTAYTATNAISYNEVVNAIDLLEEEDNTEKVIFVHPKQVTQLRLDEKFISKETYGNEVMVNGEIGMIANARVVPSKRVKLESGTYFNPIVVLEDPNADEDELPALTYFIKRDTNIETERKAKLRATEITGDQMYVVGLTNETKVVILKAKQAATV